MRVLLRLLLPFAFFYIYIILLFFKHNSYYFSLNYDDLSIFEKFHSPNILALLRGTHFLFF